MKTLILSLALTSISFQLFSIQGFSQIDTPVVVPLQGNRCFEDPNCFNRIHPDIPMGVRVKPDQLIILETRNAGDIDINLSGKWETLDPPGSTVHPITGPVYIEGARAGDVLAVTVVDIEPGPYGYTSITPGGFISDLFPETYQVVWKLNREYAETDALPGIRIPNNSFAGIMMTLPGPVSQREYLEREADLLAVNGAVSPPEPENAAPLKLCGPDGTKRGECLRTYPPREIGGNVDIRYLGVGVTVYLPCQVDGCGFGIGDSHFAQGDGEVSGTAIEMDATYTLRTKILKGKDLTIGPHFEGDSSLLDIPSGRFYATTGYPLKETGTIPPDMKYLEADEMISGLRNLSKDISLAGRNALIAMIDHIVNTYGLTREQAYIVTSVAVDLRIGQLVDAPNVGVTAILPLDIFKE